MGQRLNIEIVKNGEVLANSYYHWAAYSEVAIDLAIQIINKYEYIKKYKIEDYIKDKDLLFAIRLLEETGAGVCDVEKTRKILNDETNNLKLEKCKGRNEGIIGITIEDIEETRAWEEERLTIDIETKTIDFDVIRKYTREEFKAAYNEEEIKGLNIKKINRKFNNVPFEDVFELKAFIDGANYKGEYCFYNENDNNYIFLMYF